MSRKKWLVAIAAASAALTLGIGLVWAQESDGDGPGLTFLDRVAQKLGIDTPRLEQAIQEARSDQIDEAVQNGDLTQEQGERLKERLDDLPADAPFLGGPMLRGEFQGDGSWFGFGLGGPGGSHCGGKGPFGLLELRSEIAGFLGISEDQLQDELQAEGATLASVAEEHGKSRDELKAFIESKIQEKLDEAVAEDDLTQERADQVLERLGEHLDEIIDGGLPKIGHPRLLPAFAFGPLDELAGFLGTDEPQLLDELRQDGATLASVAEAHGKSRDELKAFLETQMREQLDQMVADGLLTRERADERLEAFVGRLDDLIDREWPRIPPLGGRFRERFGEDDSDNPNDAVPQSFEDGSFRS